MSFSPEQGRLFEQGRRQTINVRLMSRQSQAEVAAVTGLAYKPEIHIRFSLAFLWTALGLII